RLLEANNCIGWHWYHYTDNDPSGKASDTSGTYSNKGLVSNTHKEYKELTSHMAEINKNVYSLIDYFDAE
ncbi:MAG: agarase, partial [Clostridia bacterium]|nr:agarase [Clostridia bacterium]